MTAPATKRGYLAGLSRNIFLIALASLFADISTEMLYPVIPTFLTQTLHATGSIVGLVDGAAQATQNIIQGFSGAISDKLVSRHPHVFGDARVADADGVLRQWAALKREEKRARGGGESVLEGVPRELGQILLGSLLPLALIYTPALAKCRMTLIAACILIIIGGLALVYTLIVGGQAFPLEIFPGMEVLETTFFDGATTQYVPTLPEVFLGLGGIADALVIVALSVKVLSLLPENLDDTTTDPHHKAG